MKITIDTDNKKIQINSEVTIHELMKFIKEFNLENYNIIPKLDIQISTQNPYIIPHINC